MILEDNNICNGKNSDGAIFKKRKNRLRIISRGKGYEKGNNQNPSQKEQLWDKHGSGSKISKESKYHFHYSFISIHLLEISECSRIHRTRQNSCPGEKNQRPTSVNVQTPWTVAYQAPPSMGFSRQEQWPHTVEAWWKILSITLLACGMSATVWQFEHFLALE